jgi:cell division protein ZapA (FtsZ GTPase activity inhibitor)
MAKTIEITIGGRKYTLKGENEDIVKEAASQVNIEMDMLKSRLNNQSVETLSILAALNIAEKENINRKQHETDTKFIIDELNNMAEYLKNNTA